MMHRNWYRRAVSSCLALSLTFSGNVYASASPNDVKGHWAEKQLTDWQTKGFIHGYEDGSIKPDTSISRAEFITLVNKAFNFATEAPISFRDVKKEDWYYSEVAKAKAAGYISGYENETIRPNDKISRQEVAVILAKLAKLDTEKNENAVAYLLDSINIPQWSKASINEVLDKGFMKGYPNQTFELESHITRGEAVVALDHVIRHHSIKNFDKAGTYEPAKNSQTIDGDVDITTGGVKLKNTVINGNLVLDKAIAEGDVNLQSVTVKGTLFVQGGGEHGVQLINSTIDNVIVNKENGKVRLVAEGKTSIKSVDLQSGAVLEESDLSENQTGFTDVKIESTVLSSATVTLAGNFNKVNVGAPRLALSVEKGTISDLSVASTAANTKINLASGVKVSTLTLDAKVSVTGLGSIETAKVNVSGSKFEQTPANIQKADTSITVQTPGVFTTSSHSHNTTSLDTTEPQAADETNVVKTFDAAGTYGPVPDDETIDGDVKVTASGVILQNTVINGNLLLDKAIGDGDVYLKNITVGGTLFVQGGGEHSIHLIDSTINNVIVNKADGKVRLVAEGITSVRSVDLQSGAKLEESSLLPGQNGFTNVEVESTVPSSAAVTLKGDFDQVNVGAPQSALSIEKGTISDLSVASTATDAQLNLADGVKVSTLTLDAAVSVMGKGSIDTAKVNVSGSTFEQTPTNIQKNDSVTVQTGDTPVVAYAFTGFDGFQAGVENTFSIQATASNVPVDEKVKYEATLTKDGTAVAGQEISYQDATGAWQTFTTGADGVTRFGPAGGFNPAEIGLDKGITTSFKATVKDAGQYSLKVKLVDAASGSLIGQEGSQDFTVAAPVPVPTPPTVGYTFTGFDGFQAGVENTFRIKATASSVPADEKVKYEATLTKDGTAVAGQEISYQDATGAWQTFTTGADGVARFGPAGGFNPAEIGLDKGITTSFKATVKDAGQYSLKVKLVDAASGALIGQEGSQDFTVAAPAPAPAPPPTVSYTFTGFDKFQAGVENSFSIQAIALNVPADEKVKYEATLTKDGTAVAGQKISYQDATGAWQTFTTGEDGVAQFGPADGFNPDEIGLDKGITTSFKATVKDAGQYSLKVKLVDAASGALIGQEGSQYFTVAAPVPVPIPTVSFTFAGFKGFQAGVEKIFSIRATSSNVPADEKVKYEATLTKDGEPVVGQEISYQDATGAWQTFTTSEDGVAQFGPAGGFNPAEIGLNKGITTKFKVTVQDSGRYSLKVKLVDATNGALIGQERSRDFTVAAPAPVAPPIIVTTSNFGNDPVVLIKYRGHGHNVTLPIGWSKVNGAKSYIIAMYDPDVDQSAHWAVINTPYNLNRTAKGLLKTLEWFNNNDGLGYGRPRSPKANAKHPYKVIVYALNAATINISQSSNITKDELEEALSQLLITKGELNGTYSGSSSSSISSVYVTGSGLTPTIHVTTAGVADGTPVRAELVNAADGSSLATPVNVTGTMLNNSASLQLNLPANLTAGTYKIKVEVQTGSTKIVDSSTVYNVNSGSTGALPSVNNVTIMNNPQGTPDIVIVNGLTPGNIVKVYNASIGGTLIGQSQPVSYGQNSATVTISQLGTTAGKVYVSVVSDGIESPREEIAYTYEGANSSSGLTITAVPTLISGFTGEATTLVIKSDYTFNNGDVFTVTLPTGVTWNSNYTIDGTLAGVTYHKVSNNSIQFTVAGNPTQIQIPFDIQINGSNTGSLNATVSAPPGSSIPSGSVTFCYLTTSSSSSGTLPTSEGAGYTPINEKVQINGQEITFDSLYEKNGTVLGTIRPLAESLGVQVEWNNTTKQVLFSWPEGESTLVLTVDSTWAMRNGHKYGLSAAPTMIKEKVYVPIKYVVEYFGGQVTFGN